MQLWVYYYFLSIYIFNFLGHFLFKNSKENIIKRRKKIRYFSNLFKFLRVYLMEL
jgi:hypothetical protein